MIIRDMEGRFINLARADEFYFRKSPTKEKLIVHWALRTVTYPIDATTRNRIEAYYSGLCE